MDVQVASSYRAQSGLMTNPSIIGQKVKVTGNLQDYNNFPGLKSVTDFDAESAKAIVNLLTVLKH